MSKKQKKSAEQLSTEQLVIKVDRIIAIRDIANEYRLLCTEVKADLLAKGAVEFETPRGNKARICCKTFKMWLVEKLCMVLSGEMFDVLCPRKADTKKLNQRLAATPDDKELAKCFVEMPGKPVLEVLAKGQTEGATTIGEDEEIAA